MTNKNIDISWSLKALVLFSLIFFYLQGYIFASENPLPQDIFDPPQRLIIVGDSDYTPMEFSTMDGKAKGILVDIWRLWSTKNGVPIEYRCMPIKDAVQSVKTGKADILSAVFEDGKIAPDFILTRPYLGLANMIFFHKSVYGVKELKDLSGFRIGLVRGDVANSYLAEQSKSLITVMFDSYDAMVRAAVSGEIRAFVCAQPIGQHYLELLDEEGNFTHVREPINKTLLMAAVRMDNSRLASFIDHGFSKIQDAELQSIIDKWAGAKRREPDYWVYAMAAMIAASVFSLFIYMLILQVRSRVRKAVKASELRNAELAEAEKKSRDNYERFRTLAENSTDFIIRFDSSLKIVYANPGVLMLTESTEERLIGKTVYEIGLPSSLSIRFAESINTAINRRERQRLDFQIASGLWLDCLFIPEADDNHDIISVLVTGRDITDIKKIENDLRENEAKYRSLVENTPGAVYRCRRDKSWIIEFVSDAIEDITGKSAFDFIGKESSIYLDLVHPDDQDMLRNSVFEGFHSGKGFVAEYRIKHSSGLYRWVYEGGQGVLDVEGSIHLIDGVIVDITEQRQAEEQMWKLRKFLKNIIDSMPSAIVGVDPAGRITQWNKEAEKLTRFSADSVISKRFFDIFPDIGFGMDNVRQAIMNRTPGKYSKVSIETDTAKFIADITVYPLVSNGVDGAVIRVDDVTERIRMEEMMIQSEKMLSIGGLAAGMAHEINNPLAAIIQNMQVIRSRLVEKNSSNQEAALACQTEMDKIAAYSDMRKIIRMIDLSLESGKRAASIIENMLTFSRKESVRSEPADIAEIIEKSLELAAGDYDLKKSYDFRRIKISREYEKDLPNVPCEKNRMQQVFLNVFRNGAQAMFEGGEIPDDPEFKVRLYLKRKMLCIEIKDNGPGMDEETRKRIFEPFFTTKPVGQGTGLGLSLSYFIVTENHGGFMEAESSPGKGCMITVRLPLSR